MTDAANPVTSVVQGATLVVTIDDGKANAISHAMIDALHGALDQAEGDAAIGAVAIIGRDGKFSAGFDLSVMQSGMEAARDLLRAGGELALRIYMFPKPIVLGATGHALAMGAIVLMAADVRIGADIPAKVGLNEVAIGMPVPRFAVELARDRLAAPHLLPSVLHAQLSTPADAVAVGYLDRVVPAADVAAEAVAHAEHLAATIKPQAFVLTRRFLRAELAERLRQGMDEDMSLFDINP